MEKHFFGPISKKAFHSIQPFLVENKQDNKNGFLQAMPYLKYLVIFTDSGVMHYIFCMQLIYLEFSCPRMEIGDWGVEAYRVVQIWQKMEETADKYSATLPLHAFRIWDTSRIYFVLWFY